MDTKWCKIQSNFCNCNFMECFHVNLYNLLEGFLDCNNFIFLFSIEVYLCIPARPCVMKWVAFRGELNQCCCSILVNATSTVASVKSVVTVFTPTGTPTVFNNPIRLFLLWKWQMVRISWLNAISYD